MDRRRPARHLFVGEVLTAPCLDCGLPYETSDELHDFGKVIRFEGQGGPVSIRPYVASDHHNDVRQEVLANAAFDILSNVPTYRHRITCEGGPDIGYHAAITHWPPDERPFQAFGEGRTSMDAIKAAFTKTRADSPFEKEHQAKHD